MSKINELEAKMLALQIEIEELKKGSDNNAGGRWIPEYGEKYWSIDLYGTLVLDTWRNDIFDKWSLAYKNVYKTKKIAERMKDYYLALEEARWYPTEEEWKDEDLSKYCGYYDKIAMFVDETFTMRENVPYFKTEEDCKSFYDKWKAEALIDWGIKNEL